MSRLIRLRRCAITPSGVDQPYSGSSIRYNEQQKNDFQAEINIKVSFFDNVRPRVFTYIFSKQNGKSKPSSIKINQQVQNFEDETCPL